MADLPAWWHGLKKAALDTGRSEEQELNGVTERSVTLCFRARLSGFGSS